MKTRRGKAPRQFWSTQNLVFLEPADHPVPGILRRLLALARAIIGDETVWRAGKNVEFGSLAARFKRRLHLVDLVDRDAAIGLTIESEYRLPDFGRKLDRAFRRRLALIGERPVERDAGLEIRTM